jgi:hypothetical protein
MKDIRKVANMNKEELATYLIENESAEVISEICKTPISFVELALKSSKDIAKDTISKSLVKRIGAIPYLIIEGFRDDKSYYPSFVENVAVMSDIFSYNLKNFMKDKEALNRACYAEIDITSNEEEIQDMIDNGYTVFSYNEYVVKNLRILDINKNIIPEFNKEVFEGYISFVDYINDGILENMEDLLPMYDGKTLEVPIFPR